MTGPYARTRPHPQSVGSGPRQPVQRGGKSGVGEPPTPDGPHPGKRRPPRAPSCRPHSAQSQLARARAVGLVTGPHTSTPPHPQSVGSGPRQPAQRAGSRGSESAQPRTPHTPARGGPPGTLMPPPQRAKPARKSARCGVGDGSHAGPPPQPQPVGSGPRQPAQRAGSRGWESARPRTPDSKARNAPPGHPHAAPTARKSARCGVGDGSPRPHPPAPTASG